MDKVWTVLGMMEWATDYFEHRDVPSPRLSIEWLLADVLQVNRLDLYLSHDRPLAPAELDALRPLVKRRARHEPLQYITGYTDFLDVRLQVSPDALIPRTETEQLTEKILEDYSGQHQLHFLDIGTGTGCIPIALKKRHPDWHAIAIDLSLSALDLARKNARQNNTEVDFKKMDIFAWQKLEKETEFDFIVSNPPYVLPEEKELLQPQVISYEPHLALFADNFLDLYETIIKCAEARLKSNGRLYLEIHEKKADELLNLFTGRSHWRTTLLKDFEGKERFIVSEFRNR